MDGLLGLGKEKRAVNGILHNATKQKKGLVEEIEDGFVPILDTRNEAEEEEENERVQITFRSAQTASKSSGPLCAICRIRSSPYTCPQCNIPYCSVNCFRDLKHERCSKPFAQQALEEEKRVRKDENENAFVDEEEREKMMDVLRRLQKLDTNNKQASSQTQKPQLYNDRQSKEDSDDDDQDLESEEGTEWEDISQTAERAGIDLETADTQELLAMLSAEEREQFQAMIRQAELNGGQSAEIDELTSDKGKEGQIVITKKWWNSSDVDRIDRRSPEISPKFTKDVQAIIKGMQSGRQNRDLQWNIFLVALSYVYILRYLDVNNLAASVEDNAELNSIRKLFHQLVPFFITGQCLDKEDELSQTLLNNAEDVTLWFLARLGTDAGERPAEMMQFLYKEIQRPFLSTSKVRLEDDNDGNMMCLLNDVFSIASKSDRKKIAFYAAYWRYFTDSNAYTSFVSEVHLELERLEAEVKRAEDEERWRAAHEAIEKHGGVVVPS